MNIPVLTFTPDELPVSVGLEGILLNGEPFPFTTVGPWRIEIGDDQATTLYVGIPVKLGEVPPDGR